MKRNGKGFLLLLISLMIFLIVGCASEGSMQGENGEGNNLETENDNENEASESESNNNNENENDEEDLEPVTLLMMTHWDDGQFENRIKSHVEDKYPHITIEHIESKMDEIEEKVFAKGFQPDIIMTSVNDYYLDMDLLLDLNPLIESNDFDLDRIEPSILEYLEEMSHDGELNGLPYIRPEYALVYNKDIFDLFGVSYPEDNMTWDEVIDLAQEVTGERNGVQYRGLHAALPGVFEFMLSQVEDTYLVDPETHEPIIDESETFKLYLQRLEEVYRIPGNEMASAEGDERAVNLMRSGELAMAADRAFAGTYADTSSETGIEFDFVTYPIWGGEYGEYGPNEPGNGLVVTTTSEHPEEAFRVLTYLLSDEHQTWQASTGNLPAVITQDVRDAFLTDHDHYDLLEDKNLNAITDATAAPLPIKSQYEDEILKETDYGEGLYNGEDINTIIRKLQDEAEGKAKDVLSK